MLGAPIFWSPPRQASTCDALEMTAWQPWREDLEFNETRQTNPRMFRDSLVLLLVSCVIGPISAVVWAADPYPRQPYHDVGLLYTSKSGGAIALELNGNKVGGLIRPESTYNALDPISWRQWHHWNYAKDVAAVELPRGINVITVHIVLGGNMNLAYLDFTKAE